MKKKAIIYDLDNTVYPVPSIGDKLFGPVFKLIEESDDFEGDIEEIKKEMMVTPFRVVAQRHNLSAATTEKAIKLQEELTYDEPIATFEDYQYIKEIPGERFLVTTGFLKMQQSKIDNMGIKDDFKEVHIVDPTMTSKKEVFAGIMQRYNYQPEDLLIVGDDPESEIQAANDLGIDTVLYDPHAKHDPACAKYAIKNYTELKALFNDE